MKPVSYSIKKINGLLALHGPQGDLFLTAPHSEQWKSWREEKRGPFYKAVKVSPKIIDCTAGLGQDALKLLSWDFEVLSLERDPLLFELLVDLKQRTEVKLELKLPWAIRQGDFAQTLEAHEVQGQCCYCDFMFEAKKSQSKKNMSLLQSYQQETYLPDNNKEKLQKILSWGPKRVVVKRPLKGEGLGLPLAGEIKGKTARWDILRPACEGGAERL